MTTLTLPDWIVEVNQPGYGGSFYQMGSCFALQHTRRSKETLFVGFDDLSRARDRFRVRDGFGAKLAKGMGWSYLAVQSFAENWFRDPELHTALGDLDSSGFFSEFDHVVFTGASMGAFGACAFAPIAPGCTVIAFSPQSTLSHQNAAWDKRYPKGSEQDWSGPFSDAADGIECAANAWIIYDPKDHTDYRHALRITGRNVRYLRTRHAGHQAAQFLRQIDILKDVTIKCANGTMTDTYFYHLYRKGRDTRRMLKEIMHHTIKGGNIARIEQLGRVLAARDRPGLRRELERAVVEQRAVK